MPSYIPWVLMVFVAVAGEAVALEKPCTYCHLAEKPASPDLTSPEPGLCLKCHPERTGGGEHPTGSVPNFTGAVRLPLGQGRVTCTTCHDPHTAEQDMLRLPVAELCSVCHEK